MNLVKKLFKNGNGHGRGGTALAKREGGGLLSRKGRSELDDLWRDMERDPWSLVRDPWSTLDRVSERLSTLAPWPAVDVSEDENAVTVRCDVPGLDAKDLDVQVSGNLLTVSGSRADEWSGKKRGVRRQERVSGSFSRNITLPDYVDGQKVEAKYQKGTLTVTVPKVPGKGPRRVTVQAA
ncbi:MAG TPA: Hsp20/alpha crystallin family protein [Tepidisphaeraceae bacterium]|nr:Hsp20/alpha crystallin family protein [Tepidisphaeraceae bacterium]